jgi:hypothetical protein
MIIHQFDLEFDALLKVQACAVAVKRHPAMKPWLKSR